MGSERMFPVLMNMHRREWLALGCPEAVPWSLLAPHEARAMRNHGRQSLETLSRRGGLDPTEMVAVIENREWHPMSLVAAVARLKGAMERTTTPPKGDDRG